MQLCLPIKRLKEKRKCCQSDATIETEKKCHSRFLYQHRSKCRNDRVQKTFRCVIIIHTHTYIYHVRPLPHEDGLSLRARLKRFAQKLPLRDPTLGERQPVSTLERRYNYSLKFLELLSNGHKRYSQTDRFVLIVNR